MKYADEYDIDKCWIYVCRKMWLLYICWMRYESAMIIDRCWVLCTLKYVDDCGIDMWVQLESICSQMMIDIYMYIDMYVERCGLLYIYWLIWDWQLLNLYVEKILIDIYIYIYIGWDVNCDDYWVDVKVVWHMESVIVIYVELIWICYI